MQEPTVTRSSRHPHSTGLQQNGVLFTNAFCSVPSCSPSRSAILTGQDFWRLGEAANLRGTLHKDLYSVYPFMLEEAGYHVGSHSKVWSPGSLEAEDGRTIRPDQRQTISRVFSNTCRTTNRFASGKDRAMRIDLLKRDQVPDQAWMWTTLRYLIFSRTCR